MIFKKLLKMILIMKKIIIKMIFKKLLKIILIMKKIEVLTTPLQSCAPRRENLR